MKYIGWVMGDSRNPVTPFGQQLALGETTSFPDRTSSLRLRTTSRAQGWRMGLLRSATVWVGCLPDTRNSSFGTYGCARSCWTGPGPLAGGMNMRLYAYHATLGLGAKLGGVPSAAAEKLKLPARYIAPARAPRGKFPACLAIGSPSATLLGAGGKNRLGSFVRPACGRGRLGHQQNHEPRLRDQPLRATLAYRSG